MVLLGIAQRAGRVSTLMLWLFTFRSPASPSPRARRFGAARSPTPTLCGEFHRRDRPGVSAVVRGPPRATTRRRRFTATACRVATAAQLLPHLSTRRGVDAPSGPSGPGSALDDAARAPGQGGSGCGPTGLNPSRRVGLPNSTPTVRERKLGRYIYLRRLTPRTMVLSALFS